MEITLFNEHGKPEAYIKEKDKTIFLWNGEIAAYIECDQVFSWDGQHIGWYEDDVLFDLEGYKVGSTKWACPMVTRVESNKGTKMERGDRGASIRTDISKSLKNYYSKENLTSYLKKF